MKGRRRNIVMAAILSAAVVLFGCDAGEEPVEVEYDCGEVTLHVTYGEDVALIRLGEETHTLPIAISASGARYSDGEIELWEHQGTARFTTPTRQYEACRPVAKE